MERNEMTVDYFLAEVLLRRHISRIGGIARIRIVADIGARRKHQRPEIFERRRTMYHHRRSWKCGSWRNSGDHPLLRRHHSHCQGRSRP